MSDVVGEISRAVFPLSVSSVPRRDRREREESTGEEEKKKGLTSSLSLDRWPLLRSPLEKNKNLHFKNSPAQLPPPRGTRQGREGHRGRHCLVRHGRPGRHLHAELDGHDRGAAKRATRRMMMESKKKKRKTVTTTSTSRSFFPFLPKNPELKHSDCPRLADLPD